MTEKDYLKRIAFLLERIAVKIGADLTVERKPGGAEVTVVTRTGPRIGGVTVESEGDLLPRQIETATVEAGAMKRSRIVTRPR